MVSNIYPLIESRNKTIELNFQKEKETDRWAHLGQTINLGFFLFLITNKIPCQTSNSQRRGPHTKHFRRHSEKNTDAYSFFCKLIFCGAKRDNCDVFIYTCWLCLRAGEQKQQQHCRRGLHARRHLCKNEGHVLRILFPVVLKRICKENREEQRQ